MKVHFKDVPEPTLQEGSRLVANCGAVIHNAAFAMKFDFDLGEIVDWNPLLVCNECLESKYQERFIYGLVEWRVALAEKP